MIAICERQISSLGTTADDRIIAECKWRTFQTSGERLDQEIFSKTFESTKPRNGFRQAPVNPAKRVKSRRTKRK